MEEYFENMRYLLVRAVIIILLNCDNMFKVKWIITLANFESLWIEYRSEVKGTFVEINLRWSLGRILNYWKKKDIINFEQENEIKIKRISKMKKNIKNLKIKRNIKIKE